MLIHLVCKHVLEASQTKQPIKCAPFRLPSATNPEEYVFGLGCVPCEEAVIKGAQIDVFGLETPFEHIPGGAS